MTTARPKTGSARTRPAPPPVHDAPLPDLLQTVAKERNVEIVLATLGEVGRRADAAARPVLVERYARLDATRGKHDQGATLRTAIVRALREIARIEEIPLLERAATTYEYLPPGRHEVAGALRGAALVTLTEVDPRLAAHHAARLLLLGDASPMSGEPAATAVRVLAAQGQTVLLYGYASSGAPEGEVLAESLRGLTELPSSLLGPLVERHRESRNEAVLLGLFDLLLAHPARAAYVEFLLDYLRDTPLLHLARYLARAIVAARDPALIAGLTAIAREEGDTPRGDLAREALALT